MVERQNREWLEKARELRAAENLTAADELLQQIVRQTPNQPEAMRLRSEIAAIRQRQEDEIAQKRAVARALTRARTQIAEGAFEGALRTLDEVFGLVPDHPDALTLADAAKAGVSGRDDAAQGQPAPQAIAEARQQAIAECLEAGLSAAAVGRIAAAVEELEEIRRIDPQSDAAARLTQAIQTEREMIARRARATSVHPEATIPLAPAFTPMPASTTPAPTERKPVSEADRLARAGLRAFYRAEYDKALEAFSRIPKSASGGLPRERVVFYMACSTAAMALLEGAKGRPRLQQARELFQQSQPDRNPFTLDRKYISPEIIGALEATALAQKS